MSNEKSIDKQFKLEINFFIPRPLCKKVISISGLIRDGTELTNKRL